MLRVPFLLPTGPRHGLRIEQCVTYFRFLILDFIYEACTSSLSAIKYNEHDEN